MRRGVLVLVATVLLVSLVACDSSDPKVLSDQTVTNALNSYYETHPECIRVAAEFPVQIETSKDFGERDPEKLEPFVKAGLLEKTEKTVEREKRGFPKFGKDEPPEVVEVTVLEYQPTSKGKEAMSTQKSFMTGKAKAFCYGSWKVQKVINYTEAAEKMGKKISEVKFTRKIAEPAPWATELDRKLEGLEEEEHKTVLVLTKKGWVHHKSM